MDKDSSMNQELLNQSKILLMKRFEENQKLKLDVKIPKYQLSILNKDPLSIQDLVGKKVLMNFWFTNCQPCIDELPILNEFKAEINDKNVEFIAVTFEKREPVTRFLERYTSNFTHVIEAKLFIEEIGVKYYPITMVIDESGTIKLIEKKIDMSSQKTIEAWKERVKAALAQ